jgi:hypothetical protein
VLRKAAIYSSHEENASGFRRWTDGRKWSPSRTLGEFLIYGERSASPNQSQTEIDNHPLPVEHSSQDWHQQLYGPLVLDTEPFCGTYGTVSWCRFGISHASTGERSQKGT